jgi:hypothetical protein
MHINDIKSAVTKLGKLTARYEAGKLGDREYVDKLSAVASKSAVYPVWTDRGCLYI